MGNMFRGNNFAENVKHLSTRATENVSICMSGTLTSFDPDKYLAKVMIGVLGKETGWIPVGTIMAGKGYGVIAIPEQGTEVTVLFDGGNLQNGKVILANFNSVDPPPKGLYPGEIFISSKQGAKIHLDYNGHVVINGGTRPAAGVGDSIDLNPNSPTYGKIVTGNTSILI